MEQKKVYATEISAEVAQIMGLPNSGSKGVNKIVSKFIETVIKHVEEGDMVTLTGLLTIYQIEAKEREMLSPLTQKKIIIPAHVSTRARIAKSLSTSAATKAAQA